MHGSSEAHYRVRRPLSLIQALGMAMVSACTCGAAVVGENGATQLVWPSGAAIHPLQGTLSADLNDTAERMLTSPTKSMGNIESASRIFPLDASATAKHDFSEPLFRASGRLPVVHVSTDNRELFSSLPTIDPSGNLHFTPARDTNGVAIVTLLPSDDIDLDAAAHTLKISINPVNDAPSFQLGPSQTVRTNAGPQRVDLFATNILAGPEDESDQALTFITLVERNELFLDPPAIDADGNLTYTPGQDVIGSSVVIVKLVDDGGIAHGGVDTSEPQTFSIDIVSNDDANPFGANSSDPSNSPLNGTETALNGSASNGLGGGSSSGSSAGGGGGGGTPGDETTTGNVPETTPPATDPGANPGPGSPPSTPPTTGPGPTINEDAGPTSIPTPLGNPSPNGNPPGGENPFDGPGPPNNGPPAVDPTPFDDIDWGTPADPRVDTSPDPSVTSNPEPASAIIWSLLLTIGVSVVHRRLR